MTQAVNTIIDKGLYDHYLTPLYQRENKKDSEIYTNIQPDEWVPIQNTPSVIPQELNFQIPANDYIDSLQSAVQFQIGIPFASGDLSGKVVFQKNAAIYVQASDFTGSPVLKSRLPLWSQCFFDSVQILKPNHNGNEDLNLLQEHKYRENQFATLTGQEWINRVGHDIIYTNNNTKIIFFGAASGDTTTVLWFNATLPFANISPMLGIYPYFPMGLLNDKLTIRLKLNAPAFAALGTSYQNFQMNLVLVKQSNLGKLLSNKEIPGVFTDYKYIPLFNRYTYGSEVVYQIKQQFQSLDNVQIQVLKNNTNTNYSLGFTNLTKDDPYSTSEKFTIGGFQFEQDNIKMFIRELKTWNDIIRYNEKDGSMLSQFNNVSTSKIQDYDFQEWINDFKFQLSDKSDISTTTTGFNGVKLTTDKDTFISFKGIFDYSANLSQGTLINSSTPVGYEMFLYYSRLMLIKDGDIILK